MGAKTSELASLFPPVTRYPQENHPDRKFNMILYGAPKVRALIGLVGLNLTLTVLFLFYPPTH